jgi:hypothetical protein
MQLAVKLTARHIHQERATIFLLAAVVAASASAQIPGKISFDPAPDAGIPASAMQSSKKHAHSKDQPVKVLHDEVGVVKIRYYSPTAFSNESQAKAYLAGVFMAGRGSTASHLNWLEKTGIPELEAFTFRSAWDVSRHGYLLLWPGRAVYQDFDGNWWFSTFETSLAMSSNRSPSDTSFFKYLKEHAGYMPADIDHDGPINGPAQSPRQ